MEGSANAAPCDDQKEEQRVDSDAPSSITPVPPLAAPTPTHPIAQSHSPTVTVDTPLTTPVNSTHIPSALTHTLSHTPVGCPTQAGVGETGQASPTVHHTSPLSPLTHSTDPGSPLHLE